MNNIIAIGVVFMAFSGISAQASSCNVVYETPKTLSQLGIKGLKCWKRLEMSGGTISVMGESADYGLNYLSSHHYGFHYLGGAGGPGCSRLRAVGIANASHSLARFRAVGVCK